MYFLGGSCRTKVFFQLSRRFASPNEAKKQLSDTSQSNSPPTTPETASSPTPGGLPSLVERLLTLSPQPEHSDPTLSFSPIAIEHISRSPDVHVPYTPQTISVDDPLFQAAVALPKKDQVNLVVDLLSFIARRQYNISQPEDFIPLLLQGMAHLDRKSKPNLIYSLCKGFGTFRPDGDSIIPTSRMPFGLLQYLIEFFTTQGAHVVSVLLYILLYACLQYLIVFC